MSHKSHACSSAAAALRKYQRNNDSTQAFQTAESVGGDNSKTLKSIYYNHNNNYSIDFMALYILASYFSFITVVASSRNPRKQSKEELWPRFFQIKIVISKIAKHLSLGNMTNPTYSRAPRETVLTVLHPAQHRIQRHFLSIFSINIQENAWQCPL